ncbi:NADPH-dependent FMN reductase [Streptomonospora sp. PA3]|uniref:CE1759 family FMN reductase n=1 Tax=Streptomonospora sp. PA3 TaxID=2607326 RepID=UPI0012DC91D8|nr:CE1759 family FMN reductase [Streptomonospora sp. PA3]MUL43706.1 NADPH-dependent FMN reductase [Streptomonospora sp. PA3]
MTRILAVSAGLSTPSSTRLLADRLAAAARSELDGDAAVEAVELRDYAHDITDNLLTGFPGARMRQVLDRLDAADGLILVTPTFTASYSGLFKSFIDVVDPESMRDKPVLLGATGGTERHSLMLEYALRPLMAYLRAEVVPTAVFAAGGDWGSDAGLDQRIARAAGELAQAVQRRPAQAKADPFTEPVPFEQLFDEATTR